jgi:AraC-like DNA-binding protein
MSSVGTLDEPWISGYPCCVAKVLVSIEEGLLARIDRAAEESGLSRSAYLSRLAAREVDSSPGPGRDRKVRQALRRLDRLFRVRMRPEDATAAIRADRDAR